MIRKTDGSSLSFMGIFQDPMLTIVGLVLFGTIWMAIPGEVRPSAEALEEIWSQSDTLRRTAVALLDSVHAARVDLQDAAKTGRVDVGATIDSVSRSIASVEEDIQRISDEIGLESEKPVEPDSVPEQADFERRVRMNQKELRKVAQRIELALARRTLRQMRDSLAALYAQRDETPPRNPLGATGSFGVVQATTKEVTFIELAGGRLFPMDETHHRAPRCFMWVDRNRACRQSGRSL